MSVGIDIGGTSIKIVELIDQKDGKFKLRSAGVVAYGGSPVDRIKDERDFVPLVDALKKLLKDARVADKNVVVSLPEADVFTRPIVYPLLSDSEIGSAVKWEAEQYIPFPLSEAIVQHEVLERRETSTPPQVTVLLVAVQKTLAEKYVKLMNLSKLSVLAVETELMAMVRSLAPVDQTVVIVDIGARSTNLAIAKNKTLAFSRSIPTAGEAFTRAVTQSLGVQPKQAEEYKRAYGLTKGNLEGKVSTALEPIFRVVAEEIKKAVHYYQSEEHGEFPTSLILAGGSAGLPEITAQLSKYIGIEVVVGNPFTNVVMDEAVHKSLAPYAPLYSIAVGLAMRNE